MKLLCKSNIELQYNNFVFAERDENGGYYSPQDYPMTLATELFYTCEDVENFDLILPYLYRNIPEVHWLDALKDGEKNHDFAIEIIADYIRKVCEEIGIL